MKASIKSVRSFFFVLSTFFTTNYTFHLPHFAFNEKLMLSVALVLILVGGFFLLELAFRRFHLRTFNVVMIGAFFGYLMGQAVLLIFNSVLEFTYLHLAMQPQTIALMRLVFFIFPIYLGAMMALKASDELYLSIPFVRLIHSTKKKKDFLIDSSLLSDPRIIDLASTGLFDCQWIVARFTIKELQSHTESSDEMLKLKAKRSLDHLKRLEAISSLELKINETDFHDTKDSHVKIIRLAPLIDANIFTADPNRYQTAATDGTKIISIHTLSLALKPIMNSGETIKIKIQRYGKEPRQGVGYLDDGTMVVVNGGGDYLGENIDAQVLSVKHSSTGRIIFCNAVDDELVSSEVHSGAEFL